jgi:histidinol-phosphate aminotransferase
MQTSVRRLNEGKSYFLQRMESLGFQTLHGEGNFLYVAFGRRATAIHRALQDRVLYRADSNEPCLKGYSRFSATTRERFQPLVDVVAGVTRD